MLRSLARRVRRTTSIVRRELQRAEVPTAIRLVERGDLQLLLDPTSLVDREIIEYGDWESLQQDFMVKTARNLIRPNIRALFLDLGAYFGLYSLRMARSGLFHKIVAVEGDRRNYAQLRANVFLNSLDRKIECVEAVLSDGVQQVLFWRSETHDLGNRAGVGVVGSTHTIGLTDRVNTTSVDSLVPEIGAVIFAKVDVEGHELAVIRGMQRLIEKNEILLQVECFENAIGDHERYLSTLGLRSINRIGSDSYWTNICGLKAHPGNLNS